MPSQQNDSRRILVKAVTIVELDIETGSMLQTSTVKRHTPQFTITIDSVADDLLLIGDGRESTAVAIIMDRTAQMLYAVDIMQNDFLHSRSFKQLNPLYRASDVDALQLWPSGDSASHVLIHDSVQHIATEISIDNRSISHKREMKNAIVATSLNGSASLATQQDERKLSAKNVEMEHDIRKHGHVRKIFLSSEPTGALLVVSQDDSVAMVNNNGKVRMSGFLVW